MAEYQITCCSTCDMPQSFFDERNIQYACFHYRLQDTEYPDDLGRSMPFDDFYNAIRAGELPTTSQVNVGEYLAFFEKILRSGRDILHLSFSSGLSGEYNSAQTAAGMLREKYPERTIHIVDSLCASGGYGLLVSEVADQREHGLDIHKAYEFAMHLRLKVQHWFFTTDLTHYWRGGRISGAAAFAGKLLNICPVLNMNAEGRLVSLEKVRTKKNAALRLVRHMEELAEDGLAYAGKCFITHSDCLADAGQLAQMIGERFAALKDTLRIGSIGTVIGSHTGPGTVALFYIGDERK